MTKNKPTLETLINTMLEFNKARGFFASPEDYAKSIIIEAAELLEHFQFDTSRKKLGKIPKKNWEEIGNEVADVFWYLVVFCNAAGIDLTQAISHKIEHNEKKYPAAFFTKGFNFKNLYAQKKLYRAQKTK